MRIGSITPIGLFTIFYSFIQEVWSLFLPLQFEIYNRNRNCLFSVVSCAYSFRTENLQKTFCSMFKILTLPIQKQPTWAGKKNEAINLFWPSFCFLDWFFFLGPAWSFLHPVSIAAGQIKLTFYIPQIHERIRRMAFLSLSWQRASQNMKLGIICIPLCLNDSFS